MISFKVRCFLDLNSSRNVKRGDFGFVFRKGRWKLISACVSKGSNENISVLKGDSIGARRIVWSRLSSKNSNDEGDELGVRLKSSSSSSSYREDCATSSSGGSNINSATSNGGGSSNFASFQGDPFVDKLRTQLGVMHPIPSPPLNGNILGLFVFFFFVGAVFDKILTSIKSRNGNGNDGVDVRGGKGIGVGVLPHVPSISTLLEKDLQRKESVEWVNMVLEKLWKVYRGGIENWLISLLQPVMDDLEKPDYVKRVVIKQFSLGDEPLSVRSVERRTSRRANDLQYQIGLRYTGGGRMLLMLSLKFGIIPIVVPVGVRNFDIDGELWVKLRLIPTEPFVGRASWAFVSLPKIKFDLSPFRLFNLMAIPVLSMFLTKLLTEDLPSLFVRPKKIVVDFPKTKSLGSVPNDLKSREIQEGNKDFSGELSVTLVDARKLSYILYGKTDPYAILKLGDQVISSKKNSQTTVFAPPGEPIWNQDFNMLVSDPRNQKLCIEVKDPIGLGDLSLGIGEVDLSSLEDTVPTDRIVTLQGWGLFGKKFTGEILLRLTYKSYVEDEEDERTMSKTSDMSDDELTDSDKFIDSANKQTGKGSSIPMESESFVDVLAALIVRPMDELTDSDKFIDSANKQTGKGSSIPMDELTDSDKFIDSANKQTGKGSSIPMESESFVDVLAALIVSEEFQGIVTSDALNEKSSSNATSKVSSAKIPGPNTGSIPQTSDDKSPDSGGSTLFWLAIVTSAAVVSALNIGGSSLFNP